MSIIPTMVMLSAINAGTIKPILPGSSPPKPVANIQNIVAAIIGNMLAVGSLKKFLIPTSIRLPNCLRFILFSFLNLYSRARSGLSTRPRVLAA